MEALSYSKFAAVSGGEVGATHMGDDYHYTGQETISEAQANALANCVGGTPSGDPSWDCVWLMIDIITHSR